VNSAEVCWELDSHEDPPFPVLPLSVAPAGTANFQVVRFKVDTGFSGSLGIPDEIARDLNLQTGAVIPVQTAGGDQWMRSYPVMVKMQDIGLSGSLTYAIATPRLVCGRALLVRRRWLLDMAQNQFCFLD